MELIRRCRFWSKAAAGENETSAWSALIGSFGHVPEACDAELGRADRLGFFGGGRGFSDPILPIAEGTEDVVRTNGTLNN